MKNKIYKMLSIMLAIAVVFSCCAGVFSVSAATDVTYYISASGSNDNAGTEAAPFKTIGGALTAAVAAADAGGYNTAENTVYFKLLGTDPVDYLDSSGIAHAFTLNISSKDSGAVLQPSVKGKQWFAGGKVVLENLSWNVLEWDEVYLNGNDFIIKNDVTVGWRRNFLFMASGSGNATASPYSKVQNIVYNNNTSTGCAYFVLGGGESAVFEKGITLYYNAPKISQEIRIGTAGGANAAYNGPLNIDLVATSGISIKKNKGVTFGPNAAFQVINYSGKAISYADTATTDVLATTPNYIINNNTGIEKLIDFTETAGTFKLVGNIPAGYKLKFQPKEGDAILASGETFSIPAGEYDLTLQAPVAKEVTYYVSGANGSNDNDGSEAAPFQTIGGALTKALAAAVEGDYNYDNSTVTLKLLDAYEEDADLVTYNDVSGIAFNFMLKITSDVEGAVLGNPKKGPTKFVGPITFENVTLMVNKSDELYLSGQSFIFGENATIAPPTVASGADQTYFCIGSGTDAMTIESPQNIVYKEGGSQGFTYFAIGGGKTTTYNADINLVYDAPAVSQKIRINTVSKNAKVNFNKNINFDFRNAKGITFETPNNYTFGPDAAIQIINSTGNTVNTDAMASLLETVPNYVIDNFTGVKDILTFTDVAGTFLVDTTKYVPIAISENKQAYTAADGKLVLPEAGKYKLIFEMDPEAATDDYKDYIVNRGNGLKNTFAKLANKENLKVAYYGGSVTGGSGANFPETESWRGLVSKWFEYWFPVSSITNQNMAIGGTGTSLGMYRTESMFNIANPDLVFIEFAVNDFYDGLDYEKAAGQYETIIRKIREINPKCDIVAIIVSEKSHLDKDLAGELYTTAKAHDDIAAAYGIPSIYVGRALANVVGESANWENYYADSVHPNYLGYEVMYNVIKEYLNNELNHSDYDGTAADHAAVEQVSSYLFNGDVNLIDVTPDFILQSEELGGHDYAYNAAICQYGTNTAYNPFVGAGENIDILSNGDDYQDVGKFVFKFTGTDVGILSYTNHITGYTVKIDNGEEYVAEIEGKAKPYVLATGLASAEHTIEVSPVYKNCEPHCGNSHVDWVYAFFTRDASKDSHVHKYEYISNNDATCTADGTKTGVCACGQKSNTITDEGTKLDHTFTNYVYNNDATCTADGTKTAKCDNCDATDTVAATGTAGHKYANDSDLDCDVCGELRIGLEPTLVKDAETGKWFYYVDGEKSTETALVKYSGKWFYVQNGEWDAKVTSLVKYSGKWFYVKNGKWDSKTEDLVKHNGKYFYIKNGKWNSKDKTLFKKNGKWFAISAGKWYKGETLITYSGKKFYVNKGFAQLSFSGKKKINGKTYTIKKGKVV